MTAVPLDAITEDAVQSALRAQRAPLPVPAQPDGTDPTQSAGSEANAAMLPNEPEDVSDPTQLARALIAALYGDECPLLLVLQGQKPVDADWVHWVKRRWEAHASSVQSHLHLVQRNRLFRQGQQWISSAGGAPWREPPRPKEAVRRVYNIIAPALDQRLQILSDQRPGFKITPASLDPQEQQRAEARQLALEYQYDQQQMSRKRQVAARWAQTDGVAFWHLYWDPDRGAWDDRMGDGGEGAPLGDVNTEVLRCEEVRVSANATQVDDPHYAIVKRAVPASWAAVRYGSAGAIAAQTGQQTFDSSVMGINGLAWSQMSEADRLRDQKTSDYYRLYVAPQPDVLPEGLDIVVIGDSLVMGPAPLHWGAIPLVPVRDGSTDPSYYPRPVMEQWVPGQMALNQVLSKWTDNVRVNSGGRFLGRPNAFAQETFIGGLTSIIEVKGGGPLAESLMPAPQFSVGQDAKELFALDKKGLEDMHGWNDASRGQVEGDQSGRAILAAREQVERVFAPAVGALADAFTDWAKICLKFMAWGYDVPRTLKVVGATRPDLVQQVARQDFEGVNDVIVEPVTLMPMPTSLRQFLLDSYLERGLIDARTYMRRSMFASIRNMQTPDEDQEARAARIAEAILTGAPVPPMRWQDNEAIHQDILERRILLRDDLPDQVIQTASDRWTQLAQQSAQKASALSGGAPGGASPTGGPSAANGDASPFQPLPATAPLANAAPAGIAPPDAETTLQGDAARQFEASAPQ